MAQREITAETRGFIIAAVTMAVAAWEIAFNLGVYGEIFFDKFHTLWVVATTIVIVSFLLPRDRSPIGWGGRIILLLPSSYFVVAALVVAAVGGDPSVETWQRLMVIVLATLVALAFLLVLPYVLYVVAKIINPELISFQRREKILLSCIVGGFFVAGLSLGGLHTLHLTCNDFKVSGNDPPKNCIPLNIDSLANAAEREIREVEDQLEAESVDSGEPMDSELKQALEILRACKKPCAKKLNKSMVDVTGEADLTEKMLVKMDECLPQCSPQ